VAKLRSATTSISRSSRQRFYRETIRGKATPKASTRNSPAGTASRCVPRQFEPRTHKALSSLRRFAAAIPNNWIPSVERGIREAAARGYLAVFPVTDFRATLYAASITTSIPRTWRSESPARLRSRRP